MPKETPSYYAIIPAPVRYDNELCSNAKLLYGEITALCNKDGYCWAKNEYFSKLYDVHKNTVSNWISQLKDLGFIEIKMKKNYKRHIYLTDRGVNENIEGGKGNPVDNNTYINVPKGTLSDSKKRNHTEDNFKPTKNEIAILDYWNNLELVPKHKNPNTRVYKRACKMIRKLHKGKFYKSYELDEEFKKRNNIKKSLLKKEWQYSEIKKSLDNLQLCFKEGYWPDNKNKLPKTLPDLMFNSFRNTSFFLKVSVEKPVPNNKKLKSKPIDEELLNRYYRLYEDHISNIRDEEKLIIKVNDIYKFFQKKIKTTFKNDKYWNSYFKNPNPLLKEHVKWLGRKKEVYFSYLDIESVMFTNFLIYLKKLHRGAWDFIGAHRKKKKDYEEVDDFSKIKQHIF